MEQQGTYLFLNRDDRWAGVHLAGLEIDHGRLRLASLPGLDQPLPKAISSLPEPAAPAGLAVDRGGSLYYTGPEEIFRIDGCDGQTATWTDGLKQPSGLAIHAGWNALLVAETGNNRIVAFDLDSRQIKAVWPGFDHPWSLAVDPAGSIYVGAKSGLSKLDIDGRPIASFHADSAIVEPIGVAFHANELYVLDRAHKLIVVADANGAVVRTVASGAERPLGLAAGDPGILIGDNARRRIVRVSVGDAPEYKGPVAALLLDSHGGLFVHTGPGILRLSAATRYLKRGIAWAGPFLNPSVADEQWHLVRAQAEGAHLQIFVGASNSDAEFPVDPASETPFADPAWKAVEPDVLATIIPGAAKQRLSVGLEFTSEGRTTPLLDQVRLDFDHPTYLPNLPAIYGENPDSAQFLARLLGLFQSMFEDVERRISNLPALFNPYAAPADLLRWLASWLALDLDAAWSDAVRRKSIARAFAVYGRRGTVVGLLEGLRFYLRVRAHIQEPIAQTNWWALAQECSNPIDAATSVLGVSTVLGASEPQGAVVGTTAVLDASHLIGAEDIGAPLFDDVAHRFCVHIYRGGRYSEALVAQVRTFLDREKPAHTEYHLSVVEPRMRIGMQARVGIDTVLAGAPEASKLAAPGETDLVLAGEPAGRIGESRLGSTSRLGG